MKKACSSSTGSLSLISSVPLVIVLTACSSDGSNTLETSNGADTSSSTAGVLCDYLDSTFNDSTSANATSTSEWTCSATERELTANGLPDHAVGTFPNEGNPNTISEQTVSVSYTLAPTQTDSATTLGGPAGAQGYVLNGVKIDASTAGSCDDTGNSCSLIDNSGSWSIEALGQTAFNFGTDDNNAHVQPDGAYHYHGMPDGFITKHGGGDGSTMTLIAWAADGFPIYARYGYSIADDASSDIKSMSGSYQLVSNNSASRPSTTLILWVLSHRTGNTLKDQISPVTPHDAPKEPANQLIVMGRFSLDGENKDLHFHVGLFGKQAHAQTLEITATHKKENLKQVFELSPKSNMVKLNVF